MGAISKLLPSPACPISVAEFVNALFATWKYGNQTPGSAPDAIGDTIGLAVSGGVDSMALSALCSRLQQTSLEALRFEVNPEHVHILNGIVPTFGFRAFIVDHGVRPGSDVEAEAVSKVLEERDIRTKLLRIDWVGNNRPASLPNFESVARRYRFNVLGKACRDLGINSLLLAHHEDDQAETVLMRMITGHRMFGLMGIKRTSEIPECHGIHGVHESGGLDSPHRNHVGERASQASLGHTSSTLPDETKHDLDFPMPILTESGGVKICRPLLGFSKARLIATCQAEKMPWFEDHTNKDPTVTIRNSIRHMYNNYTMPPALTKPALLDLSKRIQRKNTSLQAIANLWLSESSITRLETRTGALNIQLVNVEQFKEQSNSMTRHDNTQAAALLLRRAIMLVTPEEHVHLSSLYGAVERVFPEIFSPGGSPPSPTTFTVSGVQFRPSTAPLSPEKLSSEEMNRKSRSKCAWLISRQPHTSSPLKRPSIVIPPSLDSPSQYSWSSWTLYDGRYWFRIRNRSVTSSSVIIRPFRKEDLKSFQSSLPKTNQHSLRKLLKELAPADIRWTLPAIALRDVQGAETVVALPTLDISGPEVQTLMKWEVRYKKVDRSMFI